MRDWGKPDSSHRWTRDGGQQGRQGQQGRLLASQFEHCPNRNSRADCRKTCINDDPLPANPRSSFSTTSHSLGIPRGAEARDFQVPRPPSHPAPYPASLPRQTRNNETSSGGSSPDSPRISATDQKSPPPPRTGEAPPPPTPALKHHWMPHALVFISTGTGCIPQRR